MAIFKANSNEPIQKGKLIVIDGPDGSGKATQIDLLSSTLTSAGYDGVVFDFPQYNAASTIALEKYAEGGYGDLTPRAASVLFAIDRLEASSKIREYLDSGKIILANRYVTSNAGHQGARITDYNDRIIFYKWLENLEFANFNIPKPDLNIILNVPPDISWELISKRNIEESGKINSLDSDPAHLQAVVKAYKEAANLFANSKLVECVEEGRLLSPKEINAKVWTLVRRIALKDMEPNHQA